MQKLWRSAAILIVGLGIGVGIALVYKSTRTSDEDRVREAATAYLVAFADNDQAALCTIVSPLGRAQLSCGQGGSVTRVKLTPAERDALEHPQVTVVSVNDGRAAVRFSPKLDGRGDMQLIKLRDQWYVNA